ncbi:fibronectin type III domain-containing protein [Ruficoccus sp. ZRK36]|uniref:fibronectin type III domain-containing protein n=1 Tax=Ruficoccus sp. ZRK36 TaxID=2866311 RepID=UPI001C72D5DA|nr:fibronectin type III domain-containing protein [Ruficoccus sp. ZRK36]QYY34906.1 fibronectin type III domain-containing protein [Ruficoccus sp. ZRK36]
MAYDPVTQTPLACVTVDERPTDFVISDDYSELLVICSAAKTIDVIDLTTFTLKEKISLPVYGAWGDLDDTTANIDLGPGDIIYYLDGSWGPTLHVFDRSTGSVIQSMQWNGSAPSNSTGFMDFAVTSDKTEMIAMPQYGWSAGAHSRIIGHYTIASNGKVTFVKQSAVSDIDREPFEAPVLMRDDDKIAILKTISADPSDTDIQKQSFPTAIWSMTQDGSIVATTTKLYDYESGTQLYTIPGMTGNGSGYTYRFAQAFTSDYQFFVYFNPATRQLNSINLTDVISASQVNRHISPANGVAVIPPEKLTWTSTTGMDQYDVYLGDSLEAVRDADTSSPQYLGQVVGTDYDFTSPLPAGKTYYWRVDAVSPYATYEGPIYSFTVTDVALSTQQIEVEVVAGYDHFQTSLELGSDTSKPWAVAADDAWISFPETSGTTPHSVSIDIDASGLDVGFHESTIRLTLPSGELTIPLKLKIQPLALTHFRSDRNSEIVYAISEDTSATISKAYLLEINADTEEIERVLPVGSSVTDFTISYPDQQLLVANWKSGQLLVIDRTEFKIEKSISFKPAGATGYSEGDVYRVAAGVSGRIVVEEEDQWIDINLYDTNNKHVLDSDHVREGGGAFGPDGRYYYHGENNSSGAAIIKYDMTGDAFTLLREIRPAEISSYYGSRTVVVSEDGSRVFWAGVALDSDLNTEWKTTDIIYSTTGDGRYAFADTEIYDINLRRQVLAMPTNTRVSGFNTTTSKLITQVGDEIAFYPLTTPLSLPTPELSADAPGHTTVTLTWSDKSLETQFNIQQRELGADTWTDMATVSANQTTYQVTGLTESTEYEFRIRASAPSCSSDWSNVQPVTTTATPPGTPSLLNATAHWNEVVLIWSSVNGETGFVLERALSGSDAWTEIATPTANDTTYTDTSVVQGESYQYRVKALNKNVASNYSNIRSVTVPVRTQPATPAQVNVKVISNSELQITWVDVADEDGYRIERRTGSGDWVVLAELESGITSYTDSGLVEGTQYEYRVIAANTVGESAASGTVSAAPVTIVVLLEDDFDPILQDVLWESLVGASVQNGRGFNSGNALWFGQSSLRVATTVPLDLTNANSINFMMRAGNQLNDGSIYWDNSESGESVQLQYTTGDGIWRNMLVIDTEYPLLSRWTQIKITVPEEARTTNVQLRWTQPINSGSDFDNWAIDDLFIDTALPNLQPPDFVISSGISPTHIGIYWIASSAGDQPAQYVIERRSYDTDWEEIAVLPATQTFYNDTGLTPSTIYVYQIIARYSGLDSQPSYTVVEETRSYYVQWMLDNYGTTNIDQINPKDAEEAHPMLRYAFNLAATGAPSTVPDEGTEGMPRTFQENGYLHMEFIRRTDKSGLGVTYACKFSSNFQQWDETGVLISTTPIDADWERVVIRDTVPLTNGQNRFARVEINDSQQ